MYGLLLSILTPIALVIIGVVMAPKAGPARGRLWLGLVLMLVGSVVGLIWQGTLTMPGFLHSMIDSLGHPGFGVISAVISVITSGFFIAGVAVLASAVVLGRSTPGTLDPNRPGAAPSTYQGVGYPTSQQKPHEPGSNPYV